MKKSTMSAAVMSALASQIVDEEMKEEVLLVESKEIADTAAAFEAAERAAVELREWSLTDRVVETVVEEDEEVMTPTDMGAFVAKFFLGDKVVVPDSGFYLVEQAGVKSLGPNKGQHFCNLGFGHEEKFWYDAGKAHDMIVVDKRLVGPAVRFPSDRGKFGERFVYLERAGGEFLAHPVYEMDGDKPFVDWDGYYEVEVLIPTADPNPSSVYYTKSGVQMLKDKGETIHRRILSGEIFDRMPEDPYFRGLWLLGKATTNRPAGYRAARKGLYSLIANSYLGDLFIGGVCAIEALAYLQLGGRVRAHLADGTTLTTVGVESAAGAWHEFVNRRAVSVELVVGA